MTIAQAFNEITIAQGGTPNNGGTITGAIDALNDTLAGSDQAQGRTIEDAVRLLGQHIGGGSSINVEALTATENKTYTAPEGKAYSPVTVNVAGGASFGDPQRLYVLTRLGSNIAVNDEFFVYQESSQLPICEISSGDNVITSGFDYDGNPHSNVNINDIAAGMTVKSFFNYSEDFDYDFELAIVEAEEHEDYKSYITSVVQDLTNTVTEGTITSEDGNTYTSFTFSMPVVPEGKYLVYSVQYPY